MAMIVAEELGVPVERIQIEHANTASTQYAPASGGSQTVVGSGPAVRAAAADVKRQVLRYAAQQLSWESDELAIDEGRVVPAGDPDGAIALSQVRGIQQEGLLVGVGRRHPHPEGKIPLPFAAQFAEVEVNTNTGEIRVLRILAAHDSGRVMNKLTYDNQVFGGITMGIGFGVTERRIMDPQTGRMVNANWHDYKLPTALDVPLDLSSVPVEPGDADCNTTGARGLGEPATIPTAAAVANAVYHATGVRFPDAPMTPQNILRGMTQSGRRD
jgi:xanthine dehydrogenase YagR molybdenum-binding subunit